MKKFLMVALLLAGNANAEQMPNGCYVKYGTNGCWEGSDGYTGWIEYADRDEGVTHYGRTVETIITKGKETGQELNTCIDDYNSLVDQFNILNNQNAANIKLAATNYTAYKKQIALVAKLRKACGSKCRKIK